MNNVATPANIDDATGVISGDPQAAAATVGINSVAVGIGNLTTGLTSVGVGFKNIAGGIDGIAIGAENLTAANQTVAVGQGNFVYGSGTTALGRGCYVDAAGTNATVIDGTTYSSGVIAIQGIVYASSGSAIVIDGTVGATSPRSIAIGNGAVVAANTADANALGAGAQARVANTTNLAGALIVKRSDGSTVATAIKEMAAGLVVVMTEAVDLETADTFELVLPAGCRVYTNECGIIVTDWNTVTVQPTIQFGIVSDPDKYVAAQITTLLTALNKRERFTTLLADDAEDSADNPQFEITVGATATSMMGRAYWVLMIVEDE